MKEEERRRFESIFQIYDVAWRQFNLRREIEFKFSLTLWTALAAGVAGSLTVKDFPNLPGGHFTLCFFGLFVLGLHFLWCQGIDRAQNADQIIAFDYEKHLRLLSNAEFSDRTRDYLKTLKGSIFWSYGFRLGVTFLLVTVLIVVNWNRISEPPSHHIRAMEVQKLELEIEKLREEVRTLKRSLGGLPTNESGYSTSTSKGAEVTK